MTINPERRQYEVSPHRNRLTEAGFDKMRSRVKVIRRMVEKQEDERGSHQYTPVPRAESGGAGQSY
jgi:hypothetical protein